MGVTARYFDPRIGAGHRRRCAGPPTRAVFLESPGSLTFEIQDMPAITGALRRTGHHRSSSTIPGRRRCSSRPLALGADIVIHSGTKMFVGHSDVMMGTVSANERAMHALRSGAPHTWG